MNAIGGKSKITLSEQARSLSDRYDAVSAQMTEVFYKGFSNEEINEFESFLRRVLVNLKKASDCDARVNKG